MSKEEIINKILNQVFEPSEKHKIDLDTAVALSGDVISISKCIMIAWDAAIEAAAGSAELKRERYCDYDEVDKQSILDLKFNK